jgi:NADH:ubiquinone oxidoreductase subunit F (NADH-binding)
MSIDIIKKIKDAELLGRGGAGFSTALKWEIFKATPGNLKYIVCNASEGDPQLSKDGYILKHHLKDVIHGIEIALDCFHGSRAYFYLKKDYYKKYSSQIKKIAKDLPIAPFEKPGHYLAGEETTILETIEGKNPEPRPKPPYPSEKGIFGKPTLINNVETFYFVSQIEKNKYHGERFYCLSGDIKNKGVFKLKNKQTIREILKETKNLSQHEFFVQSGGTLGEFLLENEIDQPINGLGSIVVYDKRITNPVLLARKILKFVIYQNCDKCTPCREGTYRLFEEFFKKTLDQKILADLFVALEDTTLCPLGMIAGNSIYSLYNKLINGKTDIKNK